VTPELDSRLGPPRGRTLIRCLMIRTCEIRCDTSVKLVHSDEQSDEMIARPHFQPLYSFGATERRTIFVEV
jgi:hypothetical protein